MHSMAMELRSREVVRRPAAGRRRPAKFRRTVTIFTLAIALLVLAPTVVHMLSGSDSNAVLTYTVAQHDTLWDIAARHSGGADVRWVVQSIQQLNQMDTATVWPGQVLRIPHVADK